MTGLTQYSDRYDTVLSADEGGFIEYWQPTEPFGLPKNVPGLWSFKSETDLYEFKKVRTQHILRPRKRLIFRYSPNQLLPV